MGNRSLAHAVSCAISASTITDSGSSQPMLSHLPLTDIRIVALLPREVALATARPGTVPSDDLRHPASETARCLADAVCGARGLFVVVDGLGAMARAGTAIPR